MDLHRLLTLALDPALLLEARGIAPDPWQRSLLLGNDRQVLLCASRQSGKSTVVSALALHTALFTPGALVLLLSPSQRQSAEIFRKVLDADNALGRPIPALYRTQLRLELANGSRVRVSSNRGSITAVAMVTKRIKPLTVEGKTIHHVGIPIHWGFTGTAKPGFLANTLTPFVGDGNTQTPEFKSFLVKVEKA